MAVEVYKLTEETVYPANSYHNNECFFLSTFILELRASSTGKPKTKPVCSTNLELNFSATDQNSQIFTS